MWIGRFASMDVSTSAYGSGWAMIPFSILASWLHVAACVFLKKETKQTQNKKEQTNHVNGTLKSAVSGGVTTVPMAAHSDNHTTTVQVVPMAAHTDNHTTTVQVVPDLDDKVSFTEDKDSGTKEASLEVQQEDTVSNVSRFIQFSP